jgi:PAS domain S-box-containing protein
MADDQGPAGRQAGPGGQPGLSRASASSRRIYLLFFATLCLIAGLVGVDTALNTHMHGADDDTAEIIRTLGEQRARGQRIAVLLTRLGDTDDLAKRDRLAVEAREAVNRFERAHDGLTGRAEDDLAPRSPEGEEGTEPDAQIRSYIADARTVLDRMSEADAGPSDGDSGRRLVALYEQTDSLDQTLGALMTHHASQAATRVQVHHWVSLVTGGLSILILLGLGALVIRPVARRMDGFIREEARARLFAEAVVDTIADGVITMDGRGMIRSFSPGAERIFGHAGRDVIGRHIGLLMTDEDARTHDRHVERWRCTGSPRVLGRPNELMARRQSGALFPLQLTVTRTEIDGEDLFVGICRDITAQRETERALRWSQRALDATPNLVMVVSREHRYVYSNRAHREAMGGPSKEIIGRPVADVMGRDLYEGLLRPALDQALAGDLTSLDMVYGFPGVGRRVMSASYLPLPDDSGVTDHVLVMALDVTDRTDQFRALDRQRKALNLINAIGSRHDPDPSALVRDALDAVTRHLGMTVGLVGQADGQQCTIRYQSGLAGVSCEGQSISSTSFPARTLDAGGVIALDRTEPNQADGQPFGPDFKQKAYIGASLVVDGTPFGAVSFLSTSPRPQPFDEADQELVRLFGYWVQSQIERMQAQESLAQSEERLRRSLDFADIGTWDWTIETGALHWTDRIAPLFGGLEGALETSYDAFLNAVHPDDRAFVTASISACLETGAPYDIEHRVIWPDGTVRWLSEKGDAVRDANGRAVKMLGVVQDITRRKALENQLRQFRRVVDATELGVGIGTPDGHIAYVNAASERIFSMSRADLIGRHFATLHPDADPADLAAVAKAISLGESWQGLLTAQDGNGRSFPLNCSMGALRDDDGKIVVAFNIMEDYSAEMERQRQLRDAKTAAEAANRAKSEFLSQMSHELRTPLNAIIGFSQLLQMGKSTPLTDSQSEYVGHIRKSGEHLLALINDILDFAKVDAGMLSMTLEPVSVAEVVRESLGLMESIALDRGITIAVPDLPEDLRVRADHTRLTQVLVNLLSNAIKYNEAGGSVGIDIEPSHVGADGRARCRISIHDTGIGMTDRQIANLFQPFNRLGAEALGIDGTGIGLVLSRQLVESMGGTVSVESAPGSGSTFTLDLACVTQACPGLEGAAVNGCHGPGGTAENDTAATRRMLYVAHSPAHQDLMRSYIEGRRDIALRVVHTGDLALDSARTDPPDVIVLDINLPDLDGLTVLARLRQRPTTAAIPVIALSTDATSSEIRRGLEAGFAAYLAKPLDLAALDTTLNVALGLA